MRRVLPPGKKQPTESSGQRNQHQLTFHAIALNDISSSTTPPSDTLSVWLDKYMLFSVPGLLFVGAGLAFGWMLVCGRSAAVRLVRLGSGAVL